MLLLAHQFKAAIAFTDDFLSVKEASIYSDMINRFN